MLYCNSKSKAGGSAIDMADRNNSLAPILETKIKDNFCKDIWVEIVLDKNETLIVGSIYMHPTNDFKCFEDSYIDVVKSSNPAKSF